MHAVDTDMPLQCMLQRERVHLGHYMKAIEDLQCFGATFADDTHALPTHSRRTIDAYLSIYERVF